MRTTIDSAGRIVVPKKLRDRLGLTGGTEVVIEEDGLGLRVERAATGRRSEVVERDGRSVLVGDATSSLSVESVRDLVEEIRDRRP